MNQSQAEIFSTQNQLHLECGVESYLSVKDKIALVQHIFYRYYNLSTLEQGLSLIPLYTNSPNNIIFLLNAKAYYAQPGQMR